MSCVLWVIESSGVGYFIVWKRMVGVDKYLVKRNSYQLLSAPVSIWLARTRLLEGKTKHFIFHRQSPFSPFSFHFCNVCLQGWGWIFWRSYCGEVCHVKRSHLCMSQANLLLTPHTLFVASLEKHLGALMALVCLLLSHFFVMVVRLTETGVLN